MSKMKPYANLTPKEKREHLALLVSAVERAKLNLKYWESCFAQLKGNKDE